MIYAHNETKRVSVLQPSVRLSDLLWVIRSSLWSSWWLLEAVKGLRGFCGLMRLLLSSSLRSRAA